MKRIERLLLIFISVVSLLFSAVIFFLFCPAATVTDTIKSYQALFPEINTAIAVFCAFVWLCFFALFLTALFFPKAYDTLTFLKGKSKLQFSKRSVESAVRYSFSEISEINFSKIRVKLYKQPEKTKIFVKLSASDPTALMSMSETIKSNIESAMEASLGMTVQSVNIKITGVNGDFKNKGENAEIL